MRLLHWLSRVALLAVAVIAAAAVAESALGGPRTWEAAVSLLGAHRGLALSWSVIVLLLVLLHLLSGWRRRRDTPTCISFDGPTGSVSIGLKAVKDFIRQVSGEFAAVLSAHPGIECQGDRVDVTVDIRVAAGTHLPELCRLLQERVGERLRDQLGLEQITAVRVNVRELVHGTSPRADRGSGDG